MTLEKFLAVVATGLAPDLESILVLRETIFEEFIILLNIL
jgi:hypothetical protein